MQRKKKKQTQPAILAETNNHTIVPILKATNENYCKGVLQLSTFGSSRYLCMMIKSV